MLVRMCRKRISFTLLVGIHTGIASLENSMEVPQKIKNRGTWVAQSVKHPTLAQVMISWSVSSSPALGCVPTAQSLEPASDSVSPSLSALPSLMLSLCLKNK